MVFQDARILCICCFFLTSVSNFCLPQIWVWFFCLFSVVPWQFFYAYIHVCMYKPVVPSPCTLKNGLVFARLKSVVVTVTVFSQIIPRLNHWKNLQVTESFVTVWHHRVPGSPVCPSHRALFPFIWGWQSNSSLPKTDTFLRKGLSGVTARQLRRPS